MCIRDRLYTYISLFINIPILEALQTIQATYKLPQHIMELTKHCLTSTYFTYNNHFYGQIEGAPMSSPLLPVIANLFMNNLEKKAIRTAQLKPSFWIRYIDNCFVIWPHGKNTLTRVLDGYKQYPGKNRVHYVNGDRQRHSITLTFS